MVLLNAKWKKRDTDQVGQNWAVFSNRVTSVISDQSSKIRKAHIQGISRVDIESSEIRLRYSLTRWHSGPPASISFRDRTFFLEDRPGRSKLNGLEEKYTVFKRLLRTWRS